MFVEQYDTVLLKDGQYGCVVEAYENKNFLVDIGDSPKNWETIAVTIDDIEKIISKNS